MTPQTKKFDYDKRTFETRVTFIRDIFTEKYDPSSILTSCIQYKLRISLENYIDDLKFSAWRIYGEDPIKVLKRIDR